MKRQLIYLFAPAILLAAGCSENHTSDNEKEGYGTLRIGCETDDILAVRAAATPGADDFALRLTRDGESRSWASVTDFNTENPLLPMGACTATITSGDPEAEGYDKPCYAGSERFELRPRVQNRVQITATVANSQALVRTTEQFRAYFHDAVITVTTGRGNAFDFRFATTESPAVPDSAEPVYVCAATTLSVAGTAFRQGGDKVSFPAQALAATKPATRHIFEFDAANAGTATLRIWLDDSLTETVTIPVELNEDAIL